MSEAGIDGLLASINLYIALEPRIPRAARVAAAVWAWLWLAMATALYVQGVLQ